MTYKELKIHIEAMDKEQLNSDVTVYLTPVCEFFAAKNIAFSVEDDVLDKGHPFLIVKTTADY